MPGLSHAKATSMDHQNGIGYGMLLLVSSCVEFTLDFELINAVDLVDLFDVFVNVVSTISINKIAMSTAFLQCFEQCLDNFS